MRTIQTSLIALTLGLAANVSFAECDRPEKPTVPDGAKATMDEMVAGQTAVKGFVAAGEEFLACTEQAEKEATAAADDDAAKEEAMAANAMRVKNHNEVVDEMTAVAEEWSGAMAAFKAQSK